MEIIASQTSVMGIGNNKKVKMLASKCRRSPFSDGFDGNSEEKRSVPAFDLDVANGHLTIALLFAASEMSWGYIPRKWAF